MLLASELYLRAKGAQAVLCCKLHHDNDKRCIFRCGYGMGQAAETAPPPAVSKRVRARA
jgi:hypothetical protein